MSLALTLACIWAVLSAFVAMLPYRMQFPPGIALLVLSVPLTIFVGYTHGWLWVGIVVAAILSMFRNPLRYFYRKARGRAA